MAGMANGQEKEEPKKSLTFYVLGDYGIREPTDRARSLFSALDAAVAAAEPNEKPDFFISVGDIIGPELQLEGDFSFASKQTYFETDNLRGIPVY
jgi:hypothetical protein